MNISITLLIKLAGFAQIALATGSLAIPNILHWKAELAKTNGLIRQIFWVYAAYILVINFSFGLVSFFGSRMLVDGSALALMLTGFIAVYWISRISIQFFCFDRSNFPAGRWPRIGEAALISVFILTSVVYSTAFYHNLQIVASK